MAYDEAQLLAEREKHESWLNQQQGLAGSGIGINRDGQICIKIYTDHMPEETKRAIASVLAGVPFEFEETGEFRAL